MTKLEYIKERMSDKKLREDLLKVVPDVDALIPQSEIEFSDIQKFGLYPADQCVPFVTKQGTPFYQLDNMSMVPKGDTANYLRYGDFVFRQIEILYNMARMDNAEAHHWLKDNFPPPAPALLSFCSLRSVTANSVSFPSFSSTLRI